jgi:hypothetical protein
MGSLALVLEDDGTAHNTMTERATEGEISRHVMLIMIMMMMMMMTMIVIIIITIIIIIETIPRSL